MRSTRTVTSPFDRGGDVSHASPQSLRPTLSPAARLRAKPGLVRCNSSLGGLEQSAEMSYLRSIADCLQRRPECHLVGCEHRPPQAFLQGLYHPTARRPLPAMSTASASF